MDQVHRRFIPELLGEIGRADDVGKKHRPNAGIALIRFAAGHEHSAPRADLGATEESFRDLGLHLDQFFRDQTMRFAVNLVRRLPVRRVDQAKGFPATLVEPVFQILHAVLLLRFQISRMRRGQFFGRSLAEIVDVDV